MKRFGSKPQYIDVKYLVAAFFIMITGIGICYITHTVEQNTYKDLQLAASLRMKKAEEALKADILAQSIQIEAEDLNDTGLMGPEFTELTTTPGSVDAKRTSLNPNFAAAMIRYFYDAGLKTGDTVAIGTSGSFPGFLIASTVAATEMGLNTKVIASCGSSMHGATRPEYNIFDILIFLKKNGFADFDLLAVSGGGENDQGGSILEGILYQDTKELSLSLCIEASKITGAELLNYDRLADSIKRRLDLYGTDIDMFINIGGAAPNSGNSSYTLNFPQGLVRKVPAIPAIETKGMCFEYAARGIPVLNLLNVKQLAAENGIIYDSVPMQEPGSGLVYTTSSYNFFVIVTTLVCTLGVLVYGKRKGNTKRKIRLQRMRSLNRTLAIKIVILIVSIIIMIVAGFEFAKLRNTHDSFVATEYLTKVTSLSAYEPSLAGTKGDAPVYIFDSKKEGGTVLVVGGTHPNESAGIISSYILMENLQISKGRVIVIPVANLSAATTGLNGFAYPSFYSIETEWGEKTYRVGSRLAHPLDQWPDPLIFIHIPSGTRLSYEDARNLNRNYPGNPNGTLTEKAGSAIMSIIETERVNFAFDLHEASITYPTNNAFIVPEESSDIAFLSALSLAEKGIQMRVEISSETLRGFSHQEWGRTGYTFPFLIEVPTPFIDRIAGPMTDALIIEGKDEFLMRMSDLGFTTIDYSEEGISLDYRCALHLSSIKQAVSIGSMMFPEYEVVASWPEFTELMQNGIGFYLHDPQNSGNADKIQKVVTSDNIYKYNEQ